MFGLIYGAGFFIGNLHVSGAGGVPAAVVWGGRWGDTGEYALLWLGVAFAALAWLARLSGTSYLRGDVVFAADVQRDRLIVDGPFRYVRNPLYLGNMFLALALAILAPPLGFVIIVVGNAAWAGLNAAEESRQLASRYGAAYETFRSQVPAFMPRMTAAAMPEVAAQPSWRAALFGEAFCPALAVAIVPIALFGRAGLVAFWVIAATTLVVFAVSGWRAGRSETPAQL